ncbi:DUF1223 domain-containing protein [Fulvivirgaceae bacterium BMA10]|uniref:DUF1223 domain-containing protein n=1 Tax=Splendidivirga corallicola TaxID=3051826 RepID=A0ABT8KJB5_9BACT|nr:DUF1223 domain-containing protein [Fulvivirgaceae bacterium BMA10]
MKRLKLRQFGFLITILLFASLASGFLTLKRNLTQSPEQSSTVVVELFTSQGCSSCPSADRLLSNIIDEAEEEGTHVFGLSFHVSYWNYLGWKDPYSQEAFNKRQSAYAYAFNNSNIYTPQMVVNGQAEFVGSNKTLAQEQIKKALTRSNSIQITLEKLEKQSNSLSISYKLNEVLDSHALHFGLVERELENYVPRGENRGLTLKHDNVVRVFKSIGMNQKGVISLNIPDDIDFDKSAVIVYAQDMTSMKVKGATRASLGQL